MLVVSDTSPLRYLVEVDVVEVLPPLYGDVLTTPQVMEELCQEHFPESVKRWAQHAPAWLKVDSPREIRFLDQLDEGEASALSLACERRSNLLLVDERAGSRVAHSCGVNTIGTLGILQEAGHENLLDFHAVIHRLITETAFRHTTILIQTVIADFEKEHVRRTRRS